MIPRVYKIDHQTTADLHETAIAFAEQQFELRGRAPFMWILDVGRHRIWVETLWEDDREKYVSTKFVRRIIKELGADSYAFITEAWVAVEDAVDGKFPNKTVLPSARPENERDDVLMVTTTNRDGSFRLTRFMVYIRPPHLKNGLGPRVDESNYGKFSGRMWNLFERE